MKDLFKHDDFRHDLWKHLEEDELIAVVKIANTKLNAIIEQAPVVYGQVPPSEDEMYWFPQQSSKDIKKARLMFIEPIVKEPEKEIYIDAGVSINGEPLYKKVLK